FRIFNPTSQQQKFDPDEAYIDKWVDRSSNYPEPIVDHAEARKRALASLKQVTNK
ncbi:MAG: deoxyribodipyrimidine photo-lyase, partial [Planctomycetia bacterium]|nr:deoxyribodipyrimidine photo-lyase [Planctomycetia bacterium]